MSLNPNNIERPSANFGAIRKTFDQVLAFFAAARKAGGFVTNDDMVRTGLFTAELRPHLTNQPTADDRLPQPGSLDLSEQLYSSSVSDITKSQATYKSRILADWNTAGPRAHYYEVELSSGGTVLRADTTPALRHQFENLDPGAYQVRVRTVGAFKIMSAWSSAEITILGKTANPASPILVSALVEKNFVRVYVIYPEEVDISGATIRLGDSWDAGRVIGTLSFPQDSFLWQPDTSGNLQFWVKARDTSGLESNAATGSEIVVIMRPDFAIGALITPQVIDNNVLLKWPEASMGTYPVDHYEVRKGADFATAAIIGELKGTFTAVFETASGTYKYWVVAVDTAGLESSNPLSIYSTVAQPPDFILRDQRTLDLAAATKTNCVIDDTIGSLVAPANATETFQEHFDDNSWAGPQEQVDAGYSVFIQPGPATGSYEETIDYGATIANAKIVLDLTRTTAAGTVTITPTLSVKLNLGDAWTDYAGVYEAYAVNFRYLKVTLAFATANGGVLSITDSLLRLELKQKTLAVSVNVPSTTGDGDTVTFSDYGMTFVDVEAIAPGAPFVNDTNKDPVTVIANFSDVANPTSFKALAYDKNGTRIALTGNDKAHYIIRGY